MIGTNGTQLSYEEAGEGPAVVLVHAGVADRRGHGGSADHEGPIPHHEDLLGLLDALNIGEATLVGSSFGGAYAVDAALAALEVIVHGA